MACCSFGDACRLKFQICLTLGFFFVEFFVGQYTHTVSLVADSFHMLGDVISLCVALYCVVLSKKPTEQNTFGRGRAEVVGSFANSAILLFACVLILLECLHKSFSHKGPTDGFLVLIVGGLGLVINVIGLFSFHRSTHGHSHGGHSHGKKTQQGPENQPLTSSTNEDSATLESGSDMNMRAVFYHVMGDALGSIAVMINALLVRYVKNDYIYLFDPFVGVLIAGILLYNAGGLTAVSSKILMLDVPAHIKVEALRKRILDVPGIISLHDLHVWQFAGTIVIGSVHIRTLSSHDQYEVSRQVKEIFHLVGVHSTTIQNEVSHGEDLSPLSDCQMSAPCLASCESKMCCRQKTVEVSKVEEDKFEDASAVQKDTVVLFMETSV